MTASTQIKGNTYYTVIRWKDNTDKQWKTKWINTGLSVDGNNKRAAERKRIDTMRAWEIKLSLNDHDILFSDYLRQWAEQTKYELAPSTYANNLLTMNGAIIPWFEKRKIKLCDLKTKHIEDFYLQRMRDFGVCGSTIKRYHIIVRKALRYAVDHDCILVNPADKVKLPRAEKHIANFYSLEELKELLEYAKGSNIETVVYLAAWFGMRRGEIIGLKWNAIDFENKTLSVLGVVRDKSEGSQRNADMQWVPEAKTRTSIRSFPMSQSAVDYLLRVKAEQDERKKRKGYNHQFDDFVCVRENGDLIPLTYVSRAFPQLCEKCGLRRLKLHELRHTNISLLLEQGASMKELQEWAGHSSFKTTADIYSHIQAKSKERMTAMLDAVLS